MSSEDIPLRELDAMRSVLEAVKDLPEASVAQVLRWVGKHRGISLADGRPTPSLGSGEYGSTELASPTMAQPDPEFTTLADLFAAAEPGSGPDKVLVVAFWLQELQSAEAFQSLEVTTQLKELGHPVANTTATLNSLQKGSPRLVQQTKKAGSTKQARKSYRLTAAGSARVRSMLEGDE